jgi:flagellar basal-body rod modification protein FlgD
VIDGIGATTGATQAPQMTRRDSIDRDAWIKLLVTQMTRGQDPMNPMSPDQVASQLAQFSTVEQLMNIKDQLTAMSAADGQVLTALHGASALSTIGRVVTAIGDQVNISAEDEAPTVSAKIGAPGGEGVLKIYDSAGKVVGQRDLGFVGAGTARFELDSAAAGLEPGVYRYAIEVTNSDGSPVTVQTYTQGRVDGIRHSANGPVLTAGGIEIPLISVLEVSN